MSNYQNASHSCNKSKKTEDLSLGRNRIKINVLDSKKDPKLFEIISGKVMQVYESANLGLEKITCMLADRNRPGYVYLCGRQTVYYGKFGTDISGLKKISVAPLDG